MCPATYTLIYTEPEADEPWSISFDDCQGGP